MSIKGALNITAMLMSITTGLGSFATWTLYNAYHMAISEFEHMREYRQQMEVRIEKLETQDGLHWDQVQRDLKDIKGKIDSVFELRVRGK